MPQTRKNARSTRGRPFKAGNSGRPKGALNKTTLAVQKLLDGEAEDLTRKAIELAKGGDMAALRLCLERICPPRKERPIALELPSIETPQDTVAAYAAVVDALGAGEITPGEAQVLAGLLDSQRRAIETTDIEERLKALEKMFQERR